MANLIDMELNKLGLRCSYKTRPVGMNYIVLRFKDQAHYDAVQARGMDDFVEVVESNFDWRGRDKWGAVGVFLFGNATFDKETGEIK